MDTKPARQCGECRLCCFTHAVSPVEGETFRKKEKEWCEHCEIGGGCGIYPTRPYNCRAFNCAWLQGERNEDERPDKTGLVVHRYRQGLYKMATFAHRDRDGLWQPYSQQLAREYAVMGLIVVLRTEEKQQMYLGARTYLSMATESAWREAGAEVIRL